MSWVSPTVTSVISAWETGHDASLRLCWRLRCSTYKTLTGKKQMLCAWWCAGQAHTPYHFEVMAGVNNELAERHVPYVKPRMDWLAGPEGRKADRV